MNTRWSNLKHNHREKLNEAEIVIDDIDNNLSLRCDEFLVLRHNVIL